MVLSVQGRLRAGLHVSLRGRETAFQFQTGGYSLPQLMGTRVYELWWQHSGGGGAEQKGKWRATMGQVSDLLDIWAEIDRSEVQTETLAPDRSSSAAPRTTPGRRQLNVWGSVYVLPEEALSSQHPQPQQHHLSLLELSEGIDVEVKEAESWDRAEEEEQQRRHAIIADPVFIFGQRCAPPPEEQDEWQRHAEIQGDELVRLLGCGHVCLLRRYWRELGFADMFTSATVLQQLAVAVEHGFEDAAHWALQENAWVRRTALGMCNNPHERNGLAGIKQLFNAAMSKGWSWIVDDVLHSPMPPGGTVAVAAAAFVAAVGHGDRERTLQYYSYNEDRGAIRQVQWPARGLYMAAMFAAGAHGSPEFFEWLIATLPLADFFSLSSDDADNEALVSRDYEALKGATSSGKFAMTEHLLSQIPLATLADSRRVRYSVSLVNMVARSGRMDMLSWLREHYPGVTLFAQRIDSCVAAEAACNGHVSVVDHVLMACAPGTFANAERLDAVVQRPHTDSTLGVVQSFLELARVPVSARTLVAAVTTRNVSTDVVACLVQHSEVSTLARAVELLQERNHRACDILLRAVEDQHLERDDARVLPWFKTWLTARRMCVVAVRVVRSTWRFVMGHMDTSRNGG